MAEPAARFVFGPDRRLRKRSDFTRVQTEGRRVSTRHFVLLLSARPVTQVTPTTTTAEPAPRVAPPPTPAVARLGLVVSRKVGNAVHRARVKRLCRECFRTWPGLLPEGVDLVIIARAGASALSLDEVRAEWRDVTRQIAKRAAEALARPGGPPHVGGRRRP